MSLGIYFFIKKTSYFSNYILIKISILLDVRKYPAKKWSHGEINQQILSCLLSNLMVRVRFLGVTGTTLWVPFGSFVLVSPFKEFSETYGVQRRQEWFIIEHHGSPSRVRLETCKEAITLSVF